MKIIIEKRINILEFAKVALFSLSVFAVAITQSADLVSAQSIVGNTELASAIAGGEVRANLFLIATCLPLALYAVAIFFKKYIRMR